MRGGQVRGASQTLLQLGVQGQGWDKVTYLWLLNLTFWGFWLKLSVSVSWAGFLSLLHWHFWLLRTAGYSILGEPWRHLNAENSTEVPLPLTETHLPLSLSDTFCICMLGFIWQCQNTGTGFRCHPSIHPSGNVASCSTILPNSGSKRTDEGQMKKDTAAI